MKCIISICALIISVFSFPACCQHIFKDIPDCVGVEKVYVGEALLRNTTGATYQNIHGISIGGNAILDSLEALNIDNDVTLINQATYILNNYLKSHNMDILLKRQDDFDSTVIYGLFSPDNVTLKELIVAKQSNGIDLQVIIIKGKIDISDLNL